MDLHEVWIDSTPGKNDVIVGRHPHEALTQEKAEKIAQERVLEAKEAGTPLFAIVYSGLEGKCISGFATPDLKEEFAGVFYITIM